MCRDLFLAGLVPPLPPHEVEAANAEDRVLRGAAQKRGLTQPRASQPAKKRALPSTVPPHRSSLRRGFEYLESGHPPPPNAIKWEEVRPLKRLRGKVSLAALALSQAQAS